MAVKRAVSEATRGAQRAPIAHHMLTSDLTNVEYAEQFAVNCE